MYSLTVEHEFCAAHALVISGTPEPVHGHNFRVVVTVESVGEDPLDSDGLLCDFHTVQEVLRDVCGPMTNVSLNDVEPFKKGINPSAELIAREIFDQMQDRLGEVLRPNARIAGVRISEAPGCCAEYRR